MSDGSAEEWQWIFMIEALDGQTIGREELKARWAYSELASSRFGESFKRCAPDELYDKSRQGVSFRALSFEERADLVSRIETHPDRSGLLPALGKFDEFRCEAWTQERLLGTFCVPGLEWSSLSQFLSANPPASASELLSALDSIPRSKPFVQKEAICVVPFDDGPHKGELLLDGTLRSLLFVQSCSPHIFVWHPKVR